MVQHKHALEVDTGFLAPGNKIMTTYGVKAINLLSSSCGRLFILCADHLPEGLQSSSSAEVLKICFLRHPLTCKFFYFVL